MALFEKRKTTFFEKLLLAVGLAILIVGFYLINRLFLSDQEITWGLLTATFLWLITLLVIIVTGSSQDVKEELSILIKESVEEIKLLKKISQQQLTEIKLLRQDLKRRQK